MFSGLDGTKQAPLAETATGRACIRWSMIEKSCTARSQITLTSRWKSPRFTRVES